MQSIETAIRNALTKADSADPAIRQRIYESVWSAHERAMAANANLSDQQRIDRRDRLKIAISQVEQEMQDNPGGVSEAASEYISSAPVSDYDGGLGAPELDRVDMRPQSVNRSSKLLRKRRSKNRAEADLGYEQGLTALAQSKKRKKSWLLSFGIPVAFLVATGFIGWSVYNSLVGMRSDSGGSLAQSGNIGPVREGDEADRKDWITLFTPAQPDRISVQGRATAEIGGSGNSRYARIKSPGIADTVSFDIGEGVLDQLEGKLATFEVIVRSDDGSTVQMSVNCDLGVLGDCGRKRYDVTDQPTSLLFDINTQNVKAANSTGRIIFTSDISGNGKSVDIYAIRVKTAQ